MTPAGRRRPVAQGPAGEGPAFRDLTAADLGAAVSLSAEVGWNQVEADWRIFIDHGHVTALDDERGRLVATAAVLPLGPELAWISMVIVRAERRGLGLATRLLERCVEEIRTSGRAAGLDATPAGRPVYLSLGFEDSFGLARWRRLDPAPLAPSAWLPGVSLRPAAGGDWPRIERLDREVCGAERPFLLRALGERSAGFAAVAEDGAGRLLGFVLGRDGRTATQVGPLAAEREGVAVALAAHALDRVATPAVIDVSDRFPGLSGWLEASGFAIERPFTRMYRGRPDAFGDPSRLVAVAGPELG